MQTKEEILVLVRDYIATFPKEKERVQPLNDFMALFAGESLISRKNFTGHLTASAFIIDQQAGALLLLKHKFLDRWLQPGGHIDAEDRSLSGAALREAVEETGYEPMQLQLMSTNIFDIDSHAIPENHRKQEPAHVHHDIRFLFQCTTPRPLAISPDESTDGRWFALKALADFEDFHWVAEKIRRFT